MEDAGEAMMPQQQKKLYQQVNALGGQLRELQLKHENQSILLKHTEEDLRAFKLKYRKLCVEQQGEPGSPGASQGAGPQAALEAARRELESKDRELQKAQAFLDKTLYENGTLEASLEDLRDREAQQKAEVERLNVRLQSVQETLDSVKTVAYQFEDECRTLTEELRDLRVVEAELRESLANKDDILGSLQSEAKMIGKQKSNMNAARREKNRNTRQVLLLAENSNRVQAEMHASLLAHQRLLEELKVEYEEHAELVRAEWNLDRKAKMEDYKKLKEQLESLKIIQFEDKQQLLREQGEVVKALQTQFEEYRQTAEYLFMTEASKLEDKLRVQAAKYEEEIKYIVKAKDQHFDTMMAAKDAKILNLIEGTDLQSILIRHEQEIEQLRRSHADDLTAMRQRTEAEQRDAIAALHKQLDANNVTKSKLEDRLAKADERVREAGELNRKRLDQLAQRDERHVQELQAMQGLLEEAHRAKEKLNQEKQDLRHRIVRLKIKVKGDGDDTLPNLVKRLALEVSSLKAKYNKMVGRHEHVVEQHKRLEQKALVQKQQLDRVLIQKEAREHELSEMVRTFSRVLFSRVRSALRAEEDPTDPRPPGPGRRGRLSEGTDPAPTSDHQAMSLRHALATLQEVLDGSEGQAVRDPAAPQDPGAGERHFPEGPADENDDDQGLASPRAGGASVRFRVPSKLRAMRDGEADLVDRAEVLELARGMKYLAKFRKLSAAYADGTFRLPASEIAGSAASRNAVYEQANTLQLRTEIIGRQEDLFADKEIYAQYDAAVAGRVEAVPRRPEPGIKVYAPGSTGRSPRVARPAPAPAPAASSSSSPRHKRLSSKSSAAAAAAKKVSGAAPSLIVQPQRPGGA